MLKNSRLIGILLMICFISSMNTYAIPPSRAARREHADRNDDGIVDRKERHMEHQWEHKQRSRVSNPWEAKVDTDNDGVVERKEVYKWRHRIDANNDGIVESSERKVYWAGELSKVNTPLESQYDANGDGWLQPVEIKAMLRDRHRLISTNGKAKVDTPIEELYDSNEDGVIDINEAKAMMDDIQ